MNEQFKPATLVDPAGKRVAARTKDEADRLFASGYKLETNKPVVSNFQAGAPVRDAEQPVVTPQLKSPLTDWKNKTKVIDFIREGLKLKNNLDSDINQSNLYWRTKYEDPSSFNDERFQYMSPGDQANVRNARDAAASAQLKGLEDEKAYRAKGISDILEKTSGVMEDARLAEEMAMNKESAKYDNMYKAAQAKKAMAELGLDEKGKKIYRGVTPEQILSAIAGAEGNVPYEYSDPSRYEKGKYQFMPETWAEWSSEYNAATNQMSGLLPMSKENQDAVAKWKVEQWMGIGYSPQQIAAMWNSGKPEWEGRKGTSTITGEPYDVEGYVNRFTNNLDQLYGGGAPESENVLSPAVKAGILRGIGITEKEANEVFGRTLTDDDWMLLEESVRGSDLEDATMFAQREASKGVGADKIYAQLVVAYGRTMAADELVAIMTSIGASKNELGKWTIN